MTRAVTAIVVAGMLLAIVLGLTRGFDTRSYVVLIFIAVFGALGIAVAAKAKSGSIEPGTCPQCGGLVSRTAPYCKHCRADLTGS